MKRIVAGAAAALLFAASLCIPVSAERWTLSPEQIAAAKEDKLILAKFSDHWSLLPDTEFYPLTVTSDSGYVVCTRKDGSYQQNPDHLCLDNSIFAGVPAEQADSFLQLAVACVSDTELGLVQLEDGSYMLAYDSGAGYFRIDGQPLGAAPTYYFSVLLPSGKLPAEFFDRMYEQPGGTEVCRIYEDGITLGFVTTEELEAENSLVVRADTAQAFYVDRENRLLEAKSLVDTVADIPKKKACEIRMDGDVLEASVLEGDAQEIAESAAQAEAEFETKPSTATTTTTETVTEEPKEEHPVLFTLTTLFTVLSAGMLILMVFTWIRFS